MKRKITITEQVIVVFVYVIDSRHNRLLLD